MSARRGRGLHAEVYPFGSARRALVAVAVVDVVVTVMVRAWRSSARTRGKRIRTRRV